MKFYDKVAVSVSSWKWWDWVVASRREACIAYWWPAGWDWWKWWSVIIQCSKDENTLIQFRYKKKFKADTWENWMSHDKYWKDAEDLFLKAPIWTVIKDQSTWTILCQLTYDGQQFVAVKGGRWWLWNIHFKNSVRQFPNFALLWEPWESKDLILELQMLWDVALIGTPSVWKSTLINTVSNVKAKVADYPFTTLIPNLWVVKRWDYSFSMVDVPGLVRGASEWKWLWNEFLRHILKAKIFVFVIDLWRYDSWMLEFGNLFDEIVNYIKNRFIGSKEFWNPINDIDIHIIEKNDNTIMKVFALIDGEMKLILQKYIYIVFNKYDILDDQELLGEYIEKFEIFKKNKLKEFKWEEYEDKPISQSMYLDNKKSEPYSTISCFTRQWVDEFVNIIIDKLNKLETKDIIEIDKYKIYQDKINYIKEVTEQEIDLLVEEWYIENVWLENIRVWEVYDPEVAYYVFVLMWWNDEAEMRFWSTLSLKWILNSWEKNWIQYGDILKIKSVYLWIDDRYIKWN